MAHAVAMALASKSILRLLQVRVDNESFSSPTQGLRQVRDLLVAWGVLGPDAAYDRWEKELDLQVSSVSIAARNARAGILEYLEDTFCNLVVLATYPNKALTPWLVDASVHKRLLRHGQMMSLFLRDGGRGFVDPKTGTIRLNRILMPIAAGVDSVPAIRRIQAMLALIDCGPLNQSHACRQACAPSRRRGRRHARHADPAARRRGGRRHPGRRQ